MSELREKVTRAACNAADIHLACSYPSCGCKQLPKAIEAALAIARPAIIEEAQARLSEVERERDRMKQALEKIEGNCLLPLEKEDGVSLDVTGAKVLYKAWSDANHIARAALAEKP